jgi:hypothetical protein
MVERRSTVWIGAACLAAAGVLAACGASATRGTATSAARPGSATSVSQGASAVASPVATESNPAGDIPDTQAFVAYSAPDRSFSVEVPEGWGRTQNGRVILFSDKFNSIRIENLASARQPTVESARNSEVPAIRVAAHGFSVGEIKTTDRKAGAAVLITYRADSAQNEVTGKVAVEAVERYDFFRNGREVILTLSAPAGSDNVDAWRKVTNSFSWRS